MQLLEKPNIVKELITKEGQCGFRLAIPVYCMQLVFQLFGVLIALC